MAGEAAIDFEAARTRRSGRAWNWFDPSSRERFQRHPLVVDAAASNEERLQNIIRLTDEIYQHLSVFEQFYSNAARPHPAGLSAQPRRDRLDVDLSASVELRAVEQKLWLLYSGLRSKREGFVADQLEELKISDESRHLRLHIGSAGYLIPGWINIDAAGADLTLNVNWGLPFEDGSVDLAYSSHLLEHLRFSDQAPIFVSEILRVLSPGGVVRLVVPDTRMLLSAYAERDRDFFAARDRFYRTDDGFLEGGVASLDYLLLFSGAAPQQLSYNHKFGYDFDTLKRLLVDAGFPTVRSCQYQQSTVEALRVDDSGYNTAARQSGGEHFSLFVEAVK
jgi:SAM-dependent methyltransferase